jgi:hypothetical protein
MRVLPLVSLTAALVANGCAAGAVVPTFTTVMPPTASGQPPVPLSLVDQADVVTGIHTGLGTALGAGVAAVPGRPNTLRVSWLAGECSDRVTIVLNSVGSGYELTIHNHEGITAFTCTAGGIPRVLDIAFDRVVEPEQLSLNMQSP